MNPLWQEVRESVLKSLKRGLHKELSGYYGPPVVKNYPPKKEEEKKHEKN